jgi:flagellar protein FliT
MEKPDAPGAELIGIYEELLDVTQRMLEHAKSSRWDDLPPLESQRAQLVATLKITGDTGIGSPEFNSKKADLIQKIVALDEETRKLCAEWMVELRSIIDSLDAKKKIKKAYDI